MIFDESSYCSALTPWGAEVTRRLSERKIAGKPYGTQIALVHYLNDKGFKITKSHFTNLLKGIGASNRKSEIAAVSELLGIPLQ